MMCGERKLRKNSEFQMGFEPTTFRIIIIIIIITIIIISSGT